MAYQIEATRIKELISRATLLDDGDQYERANWQLLRGTFPNFEVYWKHFVVPFTKRIEGIEEPNERIRHRDGVDQEVKNLGITHYSVFLNLVYANEHLQNIGPSSFEDFYIHLVAACDLAEDFLTNAYLLILECRGRNAWYYRVFQEKNSYFWLASGMTKDIPLSTPITDTEVRFRR